MTIEELRKIPICDLLSHLGIKPVCNGKGGTQLMYHSPLRDDRDASFSVSVRKNLWNDYGLSQGGNVIDLAIALNGNCSFSKAASWLEEQYRSFGTDSPTLGSEMLPPSFMKNIRSTNMIGNVKTVPLAHPALLRYLQSRGIPSDIGKQYCKEVHYSVNGKPFFAVCFMNILGGMEIRNPFFKGCYGTKAPSVITLDKSRRSAACCVFEGFMDFLSYLVLQRKGDSDIVLSFPCDSIVMNSTSLVRKTIPFLQVYDAAFCYLDNDDAGRKSFVSIESAMPVKASLMSMKFQDYNDLNDYLNR